MRPFDGYPDSFGSHRASVFPHPGPAAYVPIAPVEGDVPCVGGDVVEAVEAGMKYFESVQAGLTDDGMFTVVPMPVTPSGNIVGGPSTTYRLRWISNTTGSVGGEDQVTGTEAVVDTDLSDFTVRLTALGPK